MLLAVAVIASVIALSSRDTPARVASWIGDTSCAGVKTHGYDIRSARRVIGVERALARRADGMKLIECEHAGGSIEYLRFGSVVELKAALAAALPTRRICVHDAEALLNAYFFQPSLLRTYCERLGGRIVEPSTRSTERVARHR